MTNFKKLCAFTLSELLLSLTIVGIIAVLTVPVIVSNVQKKMFATKLRNFVVEIEQLAQQELIRHRTRDLSNTDFGNPEKLLSDKHFAIVKKCSPSNALLDCWNKKSGTDGTYKTLSKSNISFGSANIQNIVLKNGIIIRYHRSDSSGDEIGRFLVDINGTDKPNIGGRDLFLVGISSNGKITPIYNNPNPKGSCRTSWMDCYNYLVKNNWVMDY